MKIIFYFEYFIILKNHCENWTKIHKNSQIP